MIWLVTLTLASRLVERVNFRIEESRRRLEEVSFLIHEDFLGEAGLAEEVRQFRKDAILPNNFAPNALFVEHMREVLQQTIQQFESEMIQVLGDFFRVAVLADAVVVIGETGEVRLVLVCGQSEIYFWFPVSGVGSRSRTRCFF